MQDETGENGVQDGETIEDETTEQDGESEKRTHLGMEFQPFDEELEKQLEEHLADDVGVDLEEHLAEDSGEDLEELEKRYEEQLAEDSGVDLEKQLAEDEKLAEQLREIQFEEQLAKDLEEQTAQDEELAEQLFERDDTEPTSAFVDLFHVAFGGAVEAASSSGPTFEDVTDEPPTATLGAAASATSTPVLSTWRKSTLAVCETTRFTVEGEMKHLEGLSPATDFRGKSWAVLLVKRADTIDVKELHQSISNHLGSTARATLVARETKNSCVVLLAKEKFKNIVLHLAGYTIQSFSCGVGSSKRVHEVAGHLLKHTNEVCTSMRFAETAAQQLTMTMNEAYHLTEDLSNSRFAEAVGNAKLMEDP